VELYAEEEMATNRSAPGIKKKERRRKEDRAKTMIIQPEAQCKTEENLNS